MPRLCSICTHPQAKQIDKATVAEPKQSLRKIAQAFSVDPTSLHRHIHNCRKWTREQFNEQSNKRPVLNLLDELAKQLQFANRLRDAASRQLDEHGDNLNTISVQQQHVYSKIIASVDLVLDKFAKIAGVYKTDAPNPQALDDIADRLLAALAAYPQAYTCEECGHGNQPVDITETIDGICAQHKLDRAEFVKVLDRKKAQLQLAPGVAALLD